MSQPLRILCADDNAMLGEMMRHLFTGAGHAMEHVDNGLEAWDRISKDLGYFDVVVTDHQMPGLDGLELVELLQQAGYAGRIVVFSSGLTREQTESYCRLGVRGMVMKPSNVEELLGAVEASARR